MTESFPAMPNGHAVVTADVNKRNLLHLVSLDVSCVLQQKNVNSGLNGLLDRIVTLLIPNVS